MRNFIYLLSLIFIFSCESKEEKESRIKLEKEKQYQRVEAAKYRSDSLARVDSIKAVFVKEQQEIAFANLKFGMSKAEVSKNTKSSYSIGDFSFFSHELFHEDKLYQISLYTTALTANYVDNKLKNQWSTIRAAIIEKYGEPDSSNPYPTFFSFQPGYVQFTDTWIIGDKEIRVHVGEESSGSTYYTGAWIYNKPTYDVVEKLRETEKNSSVEKSADLF